MKKSLLIFCSLSLLMPFTLLAQNITFKLINAASLKPIEGATVKSYLDKSLNITSDKYGHITLSVKENDTLSISKAYFHPLYLFVKVKNFDSTHVISINMLPSKEVHEPLKGNFTSLADFDYHFVHDQVGKESHLNVTGFEHQDASQVRENLMHSKKNPDGFHITPVLHPQFKGNSQYKLKTE